DHRRRADGGQHPQLHGLGPGRGDPDQHQPHRRGAGRAHPRPDVRLRQPRRPGRPRDPGGAARDPQRQAGDRPARRRGRGPGEDHRQYVPTRRTDPARGHGGPRARAPGRGRGRAEGDPRRGPPHGRRRHHPAGRQAGGLRMSAATAPHLQVVRWTAPDLETATLEPPAHEPEPEPIPQPPSVEELQALEEAAREEGYRNGYEAGHAEGLATGEAEVRRTIAQMRGILDGFTRPLARLEGEVADALGDLAVRIAGTLLGRTYKADPTLLADLVREALDAVGSTS